MTAIINPLCCSSKRFFYEINGKQDQEKVLVTLTARRGYCAIASEPRGWSATCPPACELGFPEPGPTAAAAESMFPSPEPAPSAAVESPIPCSEPGPSSAAASSIPPSPPETRASLGWAPRERPHRSGWMKKRLARAWSCGWDYGAHADGLALSSRRRGF